jgi:hypothetical protein
MSRKLMVMVSKVEIFNFVGILVMGIVEGEL